MITSRQVRAARVLLGWTQETLADKALVALTALKRFESVNGLGVRDDTRRQVIKALEAAGIVFLNSNGGEGVMLVRAPNDTARPKTAADRGDGGNVSRRISGLPAR